MEESSHELCLADPVHITGIDFNPSGELCGTIDCTGVCVISEISTNNYIYHLDMCAEDGT